MSKTEIPDGPVAHDTEVDLLVIGSGTGLAAALSAEELGLDVLVAEKANVIGVPPHFPAAPTGFRRTPR